MGSDRIAGTMPHTWPQNRHVGVYATGQVIHFRGVGGSACVRDLTIQRALVWRSDLVD